MLAVWRVSPRSMPKVFISYRRDDTGGDAGRLNDTLVHILGREGTFFDLDQIAPGVDFEFELKRALSTSDVFLALIGPKWERVIDSSGKSRLSDESDLVRIELLMALKSKTVRVVPILLNRETVPNKDDLPEILHPITRLNAFEIRRNRWDDDVTALLKKLGISQSDPDPPISAVVEWKRKNEPDSTPRRWVVYIYNSSNAQITVEEVKVSSPSRKLTIDWGPIPPKTLSDYELEESEFDPSGNRPKVDVRFHTAYGQRWTLHEGVFHPIDGTG